MGSKRDRIQSAPDLRDQVPLEEEEGALDEGGCDIGSEFGPCSPKESTDHDLKFSTTRPHAKIYLRDSSILSTAESIDIPNEEDEVGFSIALWFFSPITLTSGRFSFTLQRILPWCTRASFEARYCLTSMLYTATV
jgi:hypothetical protein